MPRVLMPRPVRERRARRIVTLRDAHGDAADGCVSSSIHTAPPPVWRATPCDAQGPRNDAVLHILGYRDRCLPALEHSAELVLRRRRSRDRRYSRCSGFGRTVRRGHPRAPATGVATGRPRAWARPRIRGRRRCIRDRGAPPVATNHARSSRRHRTPHPTNACACQAPWSACTGYGVSQGLSAFSTATTTVSFSVPGSRL